MLWNALFPPAVLIAIVKGEALPSLYQGSQEIKRGLTAEAAVNLSCLLRAGHKHKLYTDSTSKRMAWCVGLAIGGVWFVYQSESVVRARSRIENA